MKSAKKSYWRVIQKYTKYPAHCRAECKLCKRRYWVKRSNIADGNTTRCKKCAIAACCFPRVPEVIVNYAISQVLAGRARAEVCKELGVSGMALTKWCRRRGVPSAKVLSSRQFKDLAKSQIKKLVQEYSKALKGAA